LNNDTQVLHHLLRKIAEERAVKEVACSGGNLKDFAEYKNLCGVIQGLSLAESIAKDLVQKLEHDDE
jgi:hypothetical protein